MITIQTFDGTRVQIADELLAEARTHGYKQVIVVCPEFDPATHRRVEPPVTQIGPDQVTDTYTIEPLPGPSKRERLQAAWGTLTTAERAALLARAQAAERELSRWEAWHPDDRTLAALQQQAVSRDGSYSSGLAACGAYIVALEARLRDADAENKRNTDALAAAEARAQAAERQAAALLAAVQALTTKTRQGQYCFRSGNNLPMRMSKKQEKLVAAALDAARGG